MNALLLILGLALVIFGAVVLLWFSNRPGASLKWLGLELSSSGAGLPLIGLGILCVVWGINPGSDRAPAPSDRIENGSVADSAGARTLHDANDGRPGTFESACLSSIGASIPSTRIGRIEAGMRDVQLLDPSQSQTEPFLIILTDGGAPVGALRARRYQGSSSGSDLFKLGTVVDAQCNQVDQLKNLSRGGDPRSLMNWDTVRMRLGDHEYDLRIGGEGDIGVNYFVRVSP